MSKKKVILIAAAVVLITAFAVYVIFALNAKSDKRLAEITVDGEVIRVIDLSTAPDETFTVESGYGSNTVTVKSGTISVTEASCPDKICVEHGELRTELLPIVCLPNKLVITLK